VQTFHFPVEHFL